MKQYKVIYETHNGEFPMVVTHEETVEAEDISEVILKIYERCFLTYMCCEIISIVKENKDE